MQSISLLARQPRADDVASTYKTFLPTAFMIDRQTTSIMLLLWTLFISGCLNTGTAQFYRGPKRPPSETATVLATPGLACPEIRTVNGIRLDSKRNAELLPGDKIIEVYCREILIRDPFGGWYGHEFLRLSVNAGHAYELRARTEGSGRAFSYGSRCTMWIVDKATNRKVSEIIERKTRVQR